MTRGPRALSLTFGGETALVTGAASGIGAATARCLRSAGLRTVDVDLVLPRTDADAAHLQRRVAVDVRDREALDTALTEAVGDSGLSYVVNCAGILEESGFSGVTTAQWQRLLEVNLIGAYHVLDAARLHLGEGAAVVNVTSIEATHVVALTNPDPTPHYAASKAALSMLTRTSARALAGRGVRVNSVAPGFVATPMASQHGDTGQMSAALAARVPLGRFAKPEEIATSIAFLLSDQAGYLTGTELLVDGGFALS